MVKSVQAGEDDPKGDLNRGTYLALKHNKIEESIKTGRWPTWCGWRGKQEATALSTQHQTQSKQIFPAKYQTFKPKNWAIHWEAIK